MSYGDLLLFRLRTLLDVDANATLMDHVSVRLGSIFLYALSLLDVLELCTRGFSLGLSGAFVISL